MQEKSDLLGREVARGKKEKAKMQEQIRKGGDKSRTMAPGGRNASYDGSSTNPLLAGGRDPTKFGENGGKDALLYGENGMIMGPDGKMIYAPGFDPNDPNSPNYTGPGGYGPGGKNGSHPGQENGGEDGQYGSPGSAGYSKRNKSAKFYKPNKMQGDVFGSGGNFSGSSWKPDGHHQAFQGVHMDSPNSVHKAQLQMIDPPKPETPDSPAIVPERVSLPPEPPVLKTSLSVIVQNRLSERLSTAAPRFISCGYKAPEEPNTPTSPKKVTKPLDIPGHSESCGPDCVHLQRVYGAPKVRQRNGEVLQLKKQTVVSDSKDTV